MTYVGQVSREDVTRPSVSVAEQEFPPQFSTDTDTRRRGDFGLTRLLLHRFQTLDSATDNYAQTAVGLISTCRFSLLFFSNYYRVWGWSTSVGTSSSNCFRFFFHELLYD